MRRAVLPLLVLLAQRRDWSQPCSPQAEILDYLTEVAADHGILEHCRFGAEVSRAEWSPQARRWTVTLVGGEALEADLVLFGTGQLSRPAWPSIPGIDAFAGHQFHSAEWDTTTTSRAGASP